MTLSGSHLFALRLVVAGCVSLGAWASGFGLAPCAGTPAGAVKAFAGESFASDPDGYRVMRMHRDAVLGTRWAALERCGHPEWPGMSFSLGKDEVDEGPGKAGRVSSTARFGVLTGASAAIAQRIVRAGETVRLWRQEANVRLEMAGVCDEAGAAGDRIRVRVTTHQEYGDVVRYVYGLVRGPADVEMAQ